MRVDPGLCSLRVCPQLGLSFTRPRKRPVSVDTSPAEYPLSIKRLVVQGGKAGSSVLNTSSVRFLGVSAAHCQGVMAGGGTGVTARCQVGAALVTPPGCAENGLKWEAHDHHGHSGCSLALSLTLWSQG